MVESNADNLYVVGTFAQSRKVVSVKSASQDTMHSNPHGGEEETCLKKP